MYSWPRAPPAIDVRRPASAKPAARGFTLIEIMVVIVILGVLAALVVPSVLSRTDDARNVAAKSDLAAIRQALKLYRLDNQRYPTTEQGLEALVTKPADPPVPPNWKPGGYLEKLPRDPWGQPYHYLNPGLKSDVDVCHVRRRWPTRRHGRRCRHRVVGPVAWHRMRTRAASGFTLVEILVVIVVLGIAAGLAIASAGTGRTRSFRPRGAPLRGRAGVCGAARAVPQRTARRIRGGARDSLLAPRCHERSLATRR